MSSGYVFKRQTDGVQVLDDAIVQVRGDPFPFVDDRQALQLLVEPGVLHGDPGMQGERLDERLVFPAELAGGDLVGQVEPPEECRP